MNEDPKDIKSIFAEALEKKTPQDRAAYLDKACGGDADLRSKLESLLESHDQAGSFLDAPALDVTVTFDKSPLTEGPGTVIGPYKLLEKIGEGGMACVYMAEQERPLRRRVALKIIKLGMDTKQVIARFEVERQALAVMDHPNIAKVFDAGATETGRPYFVMELVKGVSITEYCDKNKLSTKERLDLFIQVCNAVQHAHQKGIIHRDIKPSNVMVTLHDGKPVPKVIDFGIAKATIQRLTEKTLFTKYAQMIGTPEYMSPEQAEMSGLDIDTRADIYSLGVLLYELLTGTTPFDAEDLRSKGYGEMQRIIRETEPLKPSTKLSTMGDALTGVAEHRKTNPDLLAKIIRGDLDWIVMKTLEKDRTRRYETANAIAADIRRHLGDEPVEAGPPSATYRLGKLIRKHRRTVAAVTVIAATLIIGLVVSTSMYFLANRARQSEAIARTQAEQAKVIAEQAEKVAQEQKNIAETKAEDLRRSFYVNSIQQASAEYKEGNIRRVRELLNACLNDLRGWEWHRLNYVSDQSVMTLRGHWGGVGSISPDGKRVISGDSEGTIRVWDLATGETLKILTGHTGYIQSLAVSADGKKIVSASRDKTIKVWDVETGAEVMTLRGDDYVSSVAISPDGRRIVSVRGDKTIKVCDAETGEELKTLRGIGLFSSSAFSPDGKRIVSGGIYLNVWDSVSGTELMTIHGHKDWITSVSFSSDGKRIVSVSRDSIKIWDAETGVEVATLRRGHESITESVAFSPDGRFVVSGDRDNTVRVWDVSGGDEVKNFRGHEDYVNFVAFTPDGKQIISGSSDGTIKVWDVTIDREVTKLIGHSGIVFSIAFSPDGKRIVSGGADDNTVKIWDAATSADVMTLRGHGDRVQSVVFSPDGKRLVSGGDDKTTKVWDVETGAEVMTLRGDVRVHSVAISPDGKRIVSGGWGGGRIKVWDAETGTELKTLQGHEPNNVFSVAFSADGKRIVSGGTDNMVRVWDAFSGDELMTLHGHTAWVASVAFSPDGEHIVSAGDDRMVKVWDAATGAEMRTLRGHDSQIKSVAFSPDGKRILSGSTDRTVKIWDAASGVELMSVASDVSLYSAAFSPDGKTIAAAGSENIMLWESAPPAGGYGPRRTARAAQIADSTRWEDVGRLIKESLAVVFKSGQDIETYRAALEKAEKANCLEPNDPGVLVALGVAQYRAGQYEDAIKTQTKVHRLETDMPPTPIIALVAEAQYLAGNYGDAVKTLTEGIEISRRILGEQDWSTPLLMNELACWQAGCPAAEVRNGAEAVKNATRACELTQWKEAMYVDTLAAAYSETGDFDSAIKWQKKAINLLTKKEPAEWPSEFDERLKLYESGKPYRESP